MSRKNYPTNLSNKEWGAIEYFLEVSYDKGGRPPKHSKREIMDAIFYVLRTGCQWRYLPHDLPPWKTVYTYFRNWKKAGVFEKMNHMLTKIIRGSMGRNLEPSASIGDSQSVKTTEKGGLKVMTAGKR
jgi:putative transposase